MKIVYLKVLKHNRNRSIKVKFMTFTILVY